MKGGRTDANSAGSAAPAACPDGAAVLLPVYEGGVPLGRYSAARAVFTLPFRKATLPAAASFVKTVFLNFLVLQQKRRFGLSAIPVLSIDHPLDGKIPFTPSKVRIYMDFVSFFLRIHAMLLARLGGRRAEPLCASYLAFLGSLYEDGGSIYSRCMTTTDRPHYKRSPKFLTIHLFDPHLLCAPSLHVAIAAGSFAFVRKLFAADDLPLSAEEKAALLSEIYSGAAAITESVLFVKQHSINCVAGAFYMLTAAHEPGFFTAADAAAFTDALFSRGDGLAEPDKSALRASMLDSYGRLCAAFEASPEAGWRAPFFQWFKEYAAETGQLEIAAELADF